MKKKIKKKVWLETKTLKKGDWISPKRLEEMFGVPITDSRYNLHFQYLKRRVQEESLAAGKPLICKQESRGLRVLTDEEALYYKQQQHRSTVDRLTKINKQINLIDRKNLNSKDKKELSLEKKLQASILQSVNSYISNRNN